LLGHGCNDIRLEQAFHACDFPPRSHDKSVGLVGKCEADAKEGKENDLYFKVVEGDDGVEVGAAHEGE